MPCINRFESRLAMLRNYAGLSIRAQGSLSSCFLLHWTLCPNSLSGLKSRIRGPYKCQNNGTSTNRSSSIYVNGLGTLLDSSHQPFLLKGEDFWMFWNKTLLLVLGPVLSDKWCFWMFAATHCFGKSHGSRSQYSDNRGKQKNHDSSSHCCNQQQQ